MGLPQGIYATWLSQFMGEDKRLAKDLASKIKIVASEEFTSKLKIEINKLANSTSGPVALFAEREIARIDHAIQPIFEQKVTEAGNMRAFGEALNQNCFGIHNVDVGSEGILLNLITGLVRSYDSKFFSHPGPDIFRTSKIHSVILITDFIGSGRRISNYLTAIWKVASVKSWASRGMLKIYVLAYSGTNEGISRVQKHPSKPITKILLSCPTVFTEFKGDDIEEIRRLCEKYDPKKRDRKESLGFGGVGALIAFAHGCPNNAPRIVHKDSPQWVPLFPGRVTSDTIPQLPTPSSSDSLQSRLLWLRQRKLSKGDWSLHTSETGKILILVMSALRFNPKFEMVISRRTGLSIPDVEEALAFLQNNGWITPTRRLTDAGARELSYARTLQVKREKLSFPSETIYIPSSMRGAM